MPKCRQWLAKDFMTLQFLRAFFLSLCASANNLHNKPMFYHILEHNCTTVWIQHADLISNDPVGIRLESIFNGKIAHYLLKKNIIDTDLDYEEAKEKYPGGWESPLPYIRIVPQPE